MAWGSMFGAAAKSTASTASKPSMWSRIGKAAAGGAIAYGSGQVVNPNRMGSIGSPEPEQQTPIKKRLGTLGSGMGFGRRY